MSNLLKDDKKLMTEYNYSKNKNVDIDKITTGSGKKIWWICKNGHEYECAINHRTYDNNGCPYCSNQKILKGYNDLATTNPEVIKYWDYEKNNKIGLNPEQLSMGTHKKAWWICDKGHSYEQEIRSKVKGIGCPVCSNRIVLKGYNDLATTNPELLKEWNYAKNEKNGITPYNIVKGKEVKVWWICPKCGLDYSCYAYSKKEKVGCPYCSNLLKKKGFNDIFTKNPKWEKYWDYEENEKEGIDPYKTSIKSKQKVNWICSKCGKKFKRSPVHMKEDCLCTKCSIDQGMDKRIETLIGISGSLKDNYPEIAKEWDYEKNGDLKPEKITSSSSKKVWWICPVGHSYNSEPSKRISGIGCPKCAKEMRISFPEKAIVFYLKKCDKNVMESYQPSFLGEKEIDIYIPSKKIGIEYDGKMYHKNKAKDILKNTICSKNGIILYRIREKGCPQLDGLSKDIYYEYTGDYRNLNKVIKEIIKDIFKMDIEVNIESDRIEIYKLVSYTIKEKSLEKLYPEIAKEWNYDKNHDLKPSQFYATSAKKVWWTCSRGHDYISTISHRTVENNGCPYCANQKILQGYNDLATTSPELLKEWDYDKNNKLEIFPEKVFKGTHKKAWWKCEKGHSWEASISNRGRRGCPICSNSVVVSGINDLATTHPKILEMWNYKKNNEINPKKVSYGSNRRVWWKCPKCNNEWQQRISHITNKIGCPKCHYNSYK